MPSTPEQRGVVFGIVPALALTILAMGMSITGYGLQTMPGGLEGRLALWVATSAVTLFPLLYCIARLANHRFLTPEDIAGSGFDGGTPKARLLQAMLQNTLEQTLLAIIANAAWCFLAPASWSAAPALTCILFLIGRIAFFAGYERGAGARAFGFALTFYPTAVMIFAITPIAVRAIASTWISG